MKTKNTIENQIKSQLENREIPVSENAWDRLEAMMEEKPKSKTLTPSLWGGWVGLAASVAVLIGLYFGWNELNSDVSKEQNTVSIEKERIEKAIEPNELESNVLETNSNVEFVENSNSEKTIENIPSKPESKPEPKSEWVNLEKLNTKPKFEMEETLFQPEIEKIDAPEKELKQETVLALHTDSVSKPKSKPNYVDPEMLLYSIENNQAVQEKNKGSRMVIIDFNK